MAIDHQRVRPTWRANVLIAAWAFALGVVAGLSVPRDTRGMPSAAMGKRPVPSPGVSEQKGTKRPARKVLADAHPDPAGPSAAAVPSDFADEPQAPRPVVIALDQTPEAFLDLVRGLFAVPEEERDGAALDLLGGKLEYDLARGLLAPRTVVGWLGRETDPAVLEFIAGRLRNTLDDDEWNDCAGDLLGVAEAGTCTDGRNSALDLLFSGGVLNEPALRDRVARLAEGDATPEVRSRAIALIGVDQGPAWCLRILATDPCVEARASAIDSLRYCDLTRAQAEELIDRWGADPNGAVRGAVAGLVGSLTGMPEAERLEALHARLERETDPDVRDEIGRVLAYLPSRAARADVLRIAATDPNPVVRRSMIELILHNHASTDEVKTLIAHLRQEQDEVVRARLVEGLCPAMGAEVRQGLLEVARTDPNPMTRWSALDRLESTMQGEELLSVMRATPPVVRDRIADKILSLAHQSARRGDPEVVLGLVDWFRDETDESRKVRIAEAARDCGGQAAVDALERMRGVDPRLRDLIDGYLSELRPPDGWGESGLR